MNGNHSPRLPPKNDAMSKINIANWPYYLRDQNGDVNEPLNSLDCIGLYLSISSLKLNPKNDSKVYLPMMKATLDLENMTAKRDGEK